MAKEYKLDKGPFKGYTVTVADSYEIEQYDDVIGDFIYKFCGCEEFLVTDESSLLDFDSGVTRKEACTRVFELYGVDISDIKLLRLLDVLKRVFPEKSKWD